MGIEKLEDNGSTIEPRNERCDPVIDIGDNDDDIVETINNVKIIHEPISFLTQKFIDFCVK